MEHFVDLAIFLGVQTGLLIWKLSSITATQSHHGEILEKVDKRGDATALLVAEIRGHCPGCKVDA
jgi:hypothetical protein